MLSKLFSIGTIVLLTLLVLFATPALACFDCDVGISSVSFVANIDQESVTVDTANDTQVFSINEGVIDSPEMITLDITVKSRDAVYKNDTVIDNTAGGNLFAALLIRPLLC